MVYYSRLKIKPFVIHTVLITCLYTHRRTFDGIMTYGHWSLTSERGRRNNILYNYIVRTRVLYIGILKLGAGIIFF